MSIFTQTAKKYSSIPVNQPGKAMEEKPMQQVAPVQKTPKQIEQETGKYQKRYFSDEVKMMDTLKGQGIDDENIRKAVVNRRNTLLKDTKLDQEEAMLLINMADAGLDTQTAVKGLTAFRDDRLKKQWDDMNPAQKVGKTYFDFVVGTLSGGVGQLGGITDFVTRGKSELGEQAMEGRDYVREAFPSKSAKVGEVAGALVTDLAVAKGAGKVAGLGKRFTAMGPIKQAVIGGAGYGALTAVGEKGEETTAGDIAKMSAVGAAGGYALSKGLPIVASAAGKVINKGQKYTTAAAKGGAEGLGKSVSRDFMKPVNKIKTEGIAPQKAYEISTKANRFNAKDIEDFKKMTGETPGEFAVKRGMTKTGDQAVEEAAKLYKKSMKEADEAIELIDGKFKMEKGTDFLGVMLGDLSERLGKTLSTNSKKVSALLNKYQKDGLSMSEINAIKRLYSENFTYTFLDNTGEAALRSKNLQDGVRKWQFNTTKAQGLKNLKEINKTTQGWRKFADSLAKKISRSSGNNEMSLTDWVALGGGEITNVGLYLGKKVGSSPKVQQARIKLLGKQQKPAIIKATRDTILQSNKLKQDANARNIFRDRTGIGVKSKPLTLPVGQTQRPAIITPQTIDRGVIQESKKGLEKTKVGNTNGIISEPKKIESIDNKGGYINPEAMIEYITKVAKNLTPNNIYTTSVQIANKIGVPVKQVQEIVKKYVDKYGEGIKDKIVDMIDEIADNALARAKLMDDGGNGKVNDKPETISLWIKSKFSDKGDYKNIPIISEHKNIKLYQGGVGENRQFWTKNKNYAEQFGKLQEKTGDFYKVDNGNRVIDVYVEKPKKIKQNDNSLKSTKGGDKYTGIESQNTAKIENKKPVISEHKKIETNKEISESFKKSAERRFKTGDLTTPEINQIRKYLESNYSGKEVQVGGSTGKIVSKPFFGKIKVKIGDDIKTLNIEDIKTKDINIEDIIKFAKNATYEGYKIVPKK